MGLLNLLQNIELIFVRMEYLGIGVVMVLALVREFLDTVKKDQELWLKLLEPISILKVEILLK